MRGASRESLAAAGDRLETLLGQEGVDASLVGGELFEVADLLDGQVSVRSALTDPSRTGDDKAAFSRELLEGRLSNGTVSLVEGTVRSRWSTDRDLADAAEALAVEAFVRSAQEQGRLDSLEDELFRFSRVVTATPTLRAALTDRGLPDDRKADLVNELLQDKAGAETVVLARRAVTHPRGRSLEAALAALGDMAAARRARLVATVTTAVPLTEEQRDRLSSALAQQFGHEVHLNVVVDGDVIGGIRVSLGDEVIDGTLATRLDEAQRRITD